MNLLTQFLEEDATDKIRQLLMQSIASLEQSNERRVQDFTFNRFNVRIDSEQALVTLEDELDTSEQGKIEIPLAIFTLALTK